MDNARKKNIFVNITAKSRPHTKIFIECDSGVQVNLDSKYDQVKLVLMMHYLEFIKIIKMAAKNLQNMCLN